MVDAGRNWHCMTLKFGSMLSRELKLKLRLPNDGVTWL